MSYLVNLDVRDRPVLVVGAGAIAARKIAALVEAGARVTVVAPRIGDDVLTLERGGRVQVERRPYACGDADDAFLVIGATDDEAVNRQVAHDARASGTLVNIVDRPVLCSFTLPAIVRRGALTIGVATDGTCPSFAAAVRASLERTYGPEYADALARLGALRARLLAAGWEPARIAKAVKQVVAAGLVEAVAAGDNARVEDLLALRE